MEKHTNNGLSEAVTNAFEAGKQGKRIVSGTCQGAVPNVLHVNFGEYGVTNTLAQLLQMVNRLALQGLGYNVEDVERQLNRLSERTLTKTKVNFHTIENANTNNPIKPVETVSEETATDTTPEEENSITEPTEPVTEEVAKALDNALEDSTEEVSGVIVEETDETPAVSKEEVEAKIKEIEENSENKNKAKAKLKRYAKETFEIELQKNVAFDKMVETLLEQI